ncbi:hypothetical protein WG947_00945 [Pontibacter sp. H259]|uniref:hypothetical protein n=1 Tax=Pontibacter sp. H259 TaxID=3133421 RepID=UPI0030BE2B0C
MMIRSMKALVVLLLLLLCKEAPGQHKNQLEVKVGGGFIVARDNYSFNTKGFTVNQKTEQEGYLYSVSVGTDILIKVAETSYTLRKATFDATRLQYSSPGASISSPLQQLSMVQHYVGASYFPVTKYNSRLSPFVYAGLGYNLLHVSHELSGVTVTTPAKGDALPTVVTWSLPAATRSVGAMGYEAAVGLKYLDSEKFGGFIQVRYNMLHQNHTNMVSDMMHMLQLEGGLIWRTLKQKQAL